MTDEQPTTGSPDPNDRPATDTPQERPAPPTRDEFLGALAHVLAYAETNPKLSDSCLTVKRAYYAAANFGDGPAEPSA